MIQIDMEMPKSCDDCRMQHFYISPMNLDQSLYCGAGVDVPNITDDCFLKRPDWCPLQEIPDNGGWTSVKDHYPTATTEYQVALSTGGVIGAWWFNGEKDFIVGDTVITNNVTHWAPLLKHPKE